MRTDQDWKPRIFWAQVEEAGEVDTGETSNTGTATSTQESNTSGKHSTKGLNSSLVMTDAIKAALGLQTPATAEKTEVAEPAVPVDPDEAKASKLASAATMAGATQSVGYSRAAGLSPAQAALMSGQQAGQNFNENYGNAYMGLKGLDMQKYGIDKGYQAQMAGMKQQKKQQDTSNWMNLLGAGLTAGAFLLSDENAKTDIKDGYGILERVTRSVPLKSYKYKGDGVERSGVMAQDLEKTPLAHTVVEDSNGQKVVDTAQLTTANTGMISELSKKVDSLAKFFKGGR